MKFLDLPSQIKESYRRRMFAEGPVVILRTLVTIDRNGAETYTVIERRRRTTWRYDRQRKTWVPEEK